MAQYGKNQYSISAFYGPFILGPSNSSGNISSLFGDSRYAPSNLSCSLDFSNNPPNIILNWNQPILQVSGYRIFKSIDHSAQMQPIGSTLTTSYIDSGLILNQPYYYRVVSLF